MRPRPLLGSDGRLENRFISIWHIIFELNISWSSTLLNRNWFLPHTGWKQTSRFPSSTTICHSHTYTKHLPTMMSSRSLTPFAPLSPCWVPYTETHHDMAQTMKRYFSWSKTVAVFARNAYRSVCCSYLVRDIFPIQPHRYSTYIYMYDLRTITHFEHIYI